MTLTVMQLLNPNLSAIDKQLSKTITESPNLFRNMPLVIDLQNLSDDTDINFPELNQSLREYGLIPVGVSNGDEQQLRAANHAGLGTLSSSSKSTTRTKARAQTKEIRPMIISQPVRSGQQIYAENTDLIILASVSNGAEILADRHIHVYGTLRGRALAGVKGDTDAKIFCQSLEAEMISIAGHYRLQDNFTVEAGIGPLHIQLDGEQISINAL